MNDEEKAAEIKLLSDEVESIIKHSTLPRRHEGESDIVFKNVGAATSAVRARCRKILRLNGADPSEIEGKGTTALMKLAGIDLNKKGSDNGE